MRDLTEKEIAKCPEGCDFYHIINNQVLFTNVLGVGVFDIHGNKVDDSILDGVFQKSRSIERPFDISQHELYDCDVQILEANKHLICFLTKSGCPEFNKQDVIAMAKHFNLTERDLK